MHPQSPNRRRRAIAVLGSVLIVGSTVVVGVARADAEEPASGVLDKDRILADHRLDEPEWYRDNIPFVDTPDDTIDAVYYYRWSAFKKAQRYTVPGTGYVTTEYLNPVWYAGENWAGGNEAHSALPDAAGYHIQDGRWLRNPHHTSDYLNFWLRGGGNFAVRHYSEWITSAAYQRFLVTGDAAELKSYLPQFIALYKRWDSDFSRNIAVNGTPSDSNLYHQTPLADATEYTETSMHSSDWFRGGRGYRPTINAYMFAAAQAISRIARMSGDEKTATEYAGKAAELRAGVQKALWDPQRQFFMQVYNDDGSNGNLKHSRTTWREAMGFAPWAFHLPDTDPKWAGAWKYLTEPQRFAGKRGLTTLERVHDFEAEQATRSRANLFDSSTASAGKYVGQIDFDDSHVTFTVDAPGPGTYPVTVHYANGTGAPSTHKLTVDDVTDNAITVSYQPTERWGLFSDAQVVTVQVPMKAGANTLRFAKGTGYAELDKITANPYFNYEAIPAQQQRDDRNCCHWNGPSWPFATSQILTGLANLLQDYPAQEHVTKETYYRLLNQFAALQHKDGKPYVAEAANADTGEWIYDGANFSEHYNHSSFIDLVLTGLLGVKPQADDSLVLKPLVPDNWSHFAIEDLPYHGHRLTIVWDRDGSHYGKGAGLRVYQDGKQIHHRESLGEAQVKVDPPVAAPARPRLHNVAANPLAADQLWLDSWHERPITQPYPKAFASYTNTRSNGDRCRSSDNPRCVQNYDSPLRATDGWIRYDKSPDNRWTNLGSPNEKDHLSVDFGAVRPIKQVKLYLYDDGDEIRAPQSYDVQYLVGGRWKSVPGQAKAPARPRANGPNEVRFPTVRTQQVRVMFVPQAGKAVGVTELESWYPAAPDVRIVNKNSNLEMGIAEASPDRGAGAVQQSPADSLNHKWQVVPTEGGHYKIINRNSGLVLGVRNASTSPGETALQWGDSLATDHHWSIVDAGGGYSKIFNRNSGLLLGVRDASTTAGAAVVQWNDTGTPDHLWKLVADDGTTPFNNLTRALKIDQASGPDGPVRPGSEAAVTVRFTDTSGSRSHDCLVDWRDGTVTATEVTVPGTCTLRHAYQTEGRHTGTVTVTNENGDSAETTVPITVTAPGSTSTPTASPTATASPTPTASPTTSPTGTGGPGQTATPSPTTAPGGSGGGLPVTGFAAATAAVVGGVLVGAGAVLYLAGRRRRIRFDGTD